MEEGIYSRVVTKQALAQRIIDGHSLSAAFSSTDTAELFNLEESESQIPWKSVIVSADASHAA